jgi:hypothetical protein
MNPNDYSISANNCAINQYNRILIISKIKWLSYHTLEDLLEMTLSCSPRLEKELENDQKAKDMFLAVADRSWFGKLLEDLENDFLQGHDGYPKTLSDEYSLLTNWKEETRSDPKNPVVFTTTSQQNNRRNITCYRRGRIGHYSNNCPTRSGQTATDSMINETTTQSESTLLTAGTA